MNRGAGFDATALAMPVTLGAVGAILALVLSGTSMNIFSMMAIIMLAGTSVYNAILILDYTALLGPKRVYTKLDQPASRGGRTAEGSRGWGADPPRPCVVISPL